MALKIPFLSSLLFQLAIRDALLTGAVLHAYKNDLTPTGATVLADLTEADFAGYAPIELDSWSAVALNGDNKAQCVETVRTWTVTGPAPANTVYGVYVTLIGGTLLYVERNPAGGVLLDTAGQSLSYTPLHTYRSEF